MLIGRIAEIASLLDIKIAKDSLLHDAIHGWFEHAMFEWDFCCPEMPPIPSIQDDLENALGLTCARHIGQTHSQCQLHAAKYATYAPLMPFS